MACRESLLRAAAGTPQHRKSGRRGVQALPGRVRTPQGGGITRTVSLAGLFLLPSRLRGRDERSSLLDARSWGSGVGVTSRSACGYPPPQPSPTRGEGRPTLADPATYRRITMGFPPIPQSSRAFGQV